MPVTEQLQVLGRPVKKGFLKALPIVWIPAIYRGGEWLFDLPEGVDVRNAMEGAAIATRAISEGVDVYAISEGMSPACVELAASIAREARSA